MYLLSRSRIALYFWLALSCGLSLGLTAMFVTWRWVAWIAPQDQPTRRREHPTTPMSDSRQ